MAFGRSFGRFGARSRVTRYPSRRASAALTGGRYAAYRSMRGFRKTGFRGRFPATRRTVAGNRAGVKRLGARTDFPAYVPRTVSLRQEQKFIEYPVVVDSPFSAAPAVAFLISASSQLYLGPMPSRADALNGRLSDRILYNSLLIRGRIHVPQYTQVSETPLFNIELFLIWDNAPSGAGPAIADIFTVGSGAFSSGFMMGLMQKPDSRDRFSLLYRYRYQLQGNLSVPPGEDAAKLSCNGDRVAVPIDLNLAINKVTSFTNTSSTGNYSDIRRGAPLLLMVSDTTNTSNCVPEFRGYIRGLFADL